MLNELLTIVESIERERGISRKLLIDALERAILTASRKSIHPATNLAVKIDPATCKIQAWAKLEVVAENPNNDQLLLACAREVYPDVKIGDVIDWEVTPRNFGRIAAQTGKQAIIQQLRQAEKLAVQAEFADQVGQLISGTVRRFDNGSLYISFGRAEGIMSPKDRVHGEQYMPGDHIRCVLTKIDVTAPGPCLIVSRACPELVRRLFEIEVAEIHEGVVQIAAIAREAGSRTKIAVSSSDPRVDAVGACVGIRGARIKSITNELNGERIDVVPFDGDIRKFAANALQPAKVQSVEVHEERHELVVHVTEEQSKLAFGKKAQNVRLSSRLVGWNISILLEGGLEEKINRAALDLAGVLRISTGTADKLVRAGFVTADGVRAADEETLFAIENINEEELELALARLKG